MTVKIGKRTVCFEVETGSNLESLGKEHVIEKMAERKKECDLLIVVVTNRKLKDSYANMSDAKAITRTEIVETVGELYK